MAEVYRAPRSHSEEMIAAMEVRGDQARTAEIRVAPNLTVVLGIRHVYFNHDGEVCATEGRWVEGPTT